MRIGIDCRLGGLAHAGIGRYCEQLVAHLTQLSSDHTWVLFFYNQDQISQSQIFSKLHSLPNVEIRMLPVRHYTLAEQTIVPFHFYQARLDLLHVPHFNIPIAYRKPFVVTIHDLLWHHYQGTKVTTLSPVIYWIKYIGYLLIAKHAIFFAKKIFVPANTVKSDIQNRFSIPDEKIVVTYEGVDTSHLTAKGDKTALDIKSPYILYVGSLYPHKNVGVVLKALKQLPHLKLCIAGSRTVFQDTLKTQAKELGVNNQIIFTGFVSDQELGMLYKNALALIQPSFSEGFGLTGIEAMALGTPVIASDIPIFTELYSTYALLFDPHKVEALVAAIKNLQSKNKQEIEQITQKAQKYAQKFDWKKMAEQTIREYPTYA